MQTVSFDFDSTLTVVTPSTTTPNGPVVDLLRRHASHGDRVVITTYRNQSHESQAWCDAFCPGRVLVRDFLREHNLPVSEIIFTNHNEKGPALRKTGAAVHYDDDPLAVLSAWEYGVRGVLVIGPGQSTWDPGLSPGGSQAGPL